MSVDGMSQTHRVENGIVLYYIHCVSIMYKRITISVTNNSNDRPLTFQSDPLRSSAWLFACLHRTSQLIQVKTSFRRWRCTGVEDDADNDWALV